MVNDDIGIELLESDELANRDERRNKYGKLTVIRKVAKHRWLCLCDCGKIKVVTSQALHIGYIKMCDRCDLLWDQRTFKIGVRQRDNLRCIVCGKTQKEEILETTKDLVVHHENGKHFDDRPENAETLCHSCHMKEHKRRQREQAIQEATEIALQV